MRPGQPEKPLQMSACAGTDLICGVVFFFFFHRACSGWMLASLGASPASILAGIISPTRVSDPLLRLLYSLLCNLFCVDWLINRALRPCAAHGKLAVQKVIFPL